MYSKLSIAVKKKNTLRKANIILILIFNLKEILKQSSNEVRVTKDRVVHRYVFICYHINISRNL